MFKSISSARFIRPVGFLSIFCAIILSFYVLAGPRIPHSFPSLIQGPIAAGNVDLDDKGVFIRAFLDIEIDGPWDSKPIQKLCARTKWEEGLTFVCEAPQGGVGNVRNVFLNCVRYAIQAGGSSSIVFPKT